MSQSTVSPQATSFSQSYSIAGVPVCTFCLVRSEMMRLWLLVLALLPLLSLRHVGAERVPLGQGLIIVANVTHKGGKN